MSSVSTAIVSGSPPMLCFVLLVFGCLLFSCLFVCISVCSLVASCLHCMGVCLSTSCCLRLPACLIVLYLCVSCMCVSGLISERCLVLLVVMVTVHGTLRWRALPADAHMHDPSTRSWRGHLHRAAYRGGSVQHTHLPG